MNNYGIKYKCEFTSAKRLDYKVYILQKGYDSAVYDLRMGGNPVQINYTNGSENKFEIIRGSECVLNFFSEYDGQFSEIMYSDKNDFVIQVWQNDELHWQGYVINDNYNEPFASAPYLMSLRATDGLGDLKLMDFASETGGVFLTHVTFAEAILNCLKLLKNGTQLITCNDIFESRIDRNVTTNETFNKITANPFFYLRNELNARKCDEVLKMILELFQCYIYYTKGSYHIERINYKINEEVIKRTYNINFEGDQSIVNTVSTDNIRGEIERDKDKPLTFIYNDHSSTFVPAYNKVITESGIIPPSNLVINNYLRHWNNDDTAPLYFNKLGNIDIQKINDPKSGDLLWMKTRVGDNEISYSTNMLQPTKNGFVGMLSAGQDTLKIKIAHKGNIRIMVKATTNTQTHYLTASGYTTDGNVSYDTWFTNSPAHCKFNYFGTGGRLVDAWYVQNVEVLLPLNTSDLTFGILPSYFAQNTDASSSAIREFTPTIKASEELITNGDTYEISSVKINNETYTDFNPILSEFENSALSNQILINTPTGRTYTKNWYRDSITEIKALTQIGIQSMLNQYRTPFRLFSGSFYGDFDISKVYEIETLQGIYMPYKCNTDLKFDTHKAEFFELLADDDVPTDKYKKYENFKDGEYTAYNQRYTGRPVGDPNSGGVINPPTTRPRRGGGF